MAESDGSAPRWERTVQVGSAIETQRLAERLFEPFVSGRASEGTGLGLTISRELAALHGGDLRLVESGPAGAVFELRLPG